LDDGSQRLRNPRHERYCVGRSRGLSQADAWARTFRKDQRIPSNDSNRVSGCRTEQRPEVAARIKHLLKARRAENAPDGIPESFDHAALVALSLEITEALELALKAAKNSSIPSTQLTRLKTVLSAHLARQGKMLDQGDTAPVNASQSAAWDRFQRLEVCSCV